METNVSLAKFTSFRIGGPAKFFVAAKNQKDFVKALDFAHQNNLPFLVIGGGTNILVRDQGFDGVAVRNLSREIKLEDNLIVADSGVAMALINQFANQNGFVGFEKLATVPGTLGGAIYNNAHWQDDLLANHIAWVEVIDPDQREAKVQKLNRQQMNFAYDTSLVKQKGLIALRAALQLPKGDIAESKKILLQYLKSRSSSQPYGTMNSGCIFQNVPEQIGPGKHGTSAGYLIEKAGLKGTKIGAAEISEKHGNFFINTGNASSADILKLAELCREKIKKQFGVELEFEVKII